MSVIDLEGLRPTPDRARETLFNWLQAGISGATCLDLFAGTGALGFEAVSRGAHQVIMVEQQLPLCDLIRQNTEMLKAEGVELIHADALQWLQSCEQKFDLVFLDPPFFRNIHDSVCVILLERDLILPDAWVYMESEPGVPVPAGFIVEKEGQAGQVKFRLLKKLQN